MEKDFEEFQQQQKRFTVKKGERRKRRKGDNDKENVLSIAIKWHIFMINANLNEF